MLLYILFIILIFYFYLMETLLPNYKKYLRNAFLIIIIILSSIRNNIGWDFRSYSNILDIYRNTGILVYDKGEYFSTLLYKLTIGFDTNNLFFIITSILIYYFIFKTLEKFSENYWLSVILFVCFPLFFLNSLSIVRHFVALALTFWGIRFLANNRSWKFFIVVLIAMQFHNSAILAVIIYFLWKFPVYISKSMTILLLFLSFIVGNIILEVLSGNFLGIYQVYFTEPGVQSGTKAIYLLLLCMIILIVHQSKSKANTNDILNQNNQYFLYNTCLFGIMFYLIFLETGTIAHRGSLYYTIFFLLSIPHYLNRMENKESIVLKYGLVLLFIISFIYTIYITVNSPISPYLPYRTIFGN